MSSIIWSILLLIHLAQAHFVLQLPLSLGFDDTNEASAPCGGSYDVKNRDKVTEFPLGGYPFHLLSTHTRSIFQYRAALLNSTTEWVDLLPPISQSGVGDFCLPAIPGNANWVGLDAVVQVAQFGPDGTLFQCAAVKFINGPAFPPPSSCKNSSRVQASVTSFSAALPSGTGIVGVVLPSGDDKAGTPVATSNLLTTTTGPAGAGNTSVGTNNPPKPTSGAAADMVGANAVRGLWFGFAAVLGALAFGLAC